MLHPESSRALLLELSAVTHLLRTPVRLANARIRSDYQDHQQQRLKLEPRYLEGFESQRALEML
jgi:hypothetical protein